MNKLEAQIELFKKEIHSDSYPMSIGEAVSMYTNGEFDIHPEFQRIYRWTLDQKTKFIESIFLGIPIPSFFVAQRLDGVWDLVDGLQRFSTILSFMGELRDEQGARLDPLILSKGGYLTELDGAQWTNLDLISSALKLTFRREKIDFKIIKKESTSDTKYELFRRINTGGSILSEQEVRNCLLLMANKDFYEWLTRLSRDENFVATTPISDDKQLEQYNLELITRFIVFNKLDWDSITASSIAELGEFLNDQIVLIAQDDRYDTNNMIFVFQNTFKMINQALGNDAFRKYYKTERRHKGGFSIALFEAISIGVSKNINSLLIEYTPENLRRMIEEFAVSDQFVYSSGSGVRANTRICNTIPAAIRHFSL